MSYFNRNHEIHSDCMGSSLGIDIFEMEKPKERAKLLTISSDTQQVRSVLDSVGGWLPAAAEEYNISADIRDYVLAPVVIMPSDLPNRNCVGFPLFELTKFNTESKMLAYKTFAAAPLHINHVNKDHTIASGVIFDVAFRKMNNVQGDIWKIIALCGFDRKRKPLICNRILNDPETTYSMGAWASAYTCSVCGNKYKEGSECEHVQLGKPAYKLFPGKGRDTVPQLAYYEARGITGFECSFIETNTPAYYSASVPKSSVIDMYGT